MSEVWSAVTALLLSTPPHVIFGFAAMQNTGGEKNLKYILACNLTQKNVDGYVTTCVCSGTDHLVRPCMCVLIVCVHI